MDNDDPTKVAGLVNDLIAHELEAIDEGRRHAQTEMARVGRPEARELAILRASAFARARAFAEARRLVEKAFFGEDEHALVDALNRDFYRRKAEENSQ